MLLQELSEKVKTGEIRREEVINLFPPLYVELKEEEEKSGARRAGSFSITKLLYVLGAVVVVVGIIALVAQVWEDLGSFGRVAITLGLGFLFAISGSMLLIQKQKDFIGSVFHVLGGMLIPGGSMVLLNELSRDVVTPWPVTITFGIIFIFYLLLAFVHTKTILTFFAVVNGTTFLYCLVAALLDSQYLPNEDDIFRYLTMAIGMSYFLLAYSFRESWNQKLVPFLCFFGSAMFFGATFTWIAEENSTLWLVLYPFLLAGGFFLSIYLKSRATLLVSTFFLVAYIGYITNEYFADSVGWPISLVFLGLAFIGLGYMSVSINKKYIHE